MKTLVREFEFHTMGGKDQELRGTGLGTYGPWPLFRLYGSHITNMVIISLSMSGGAPASLAARNRILYIHIYIILINYCVIRGHYIII